MTSEQLGSQRSWFGQELIKFGAHVTIFGAPELGSGPGTQFLHVPSPFNHRCRFFSFRMSAH